ncbi:MAG TPA: polymorphic toxin type 15 domain-containing protein, partial [Haliangium sp.]|nr:polymorphic toxin type 15 domain-containing protein [Haliangium sp.]
TIHFSASGEGHRLWVETTASGVIIKLASVEKKLSEHLDDFEGRASQAGEREGEVRSAIGTAGGIAARIAQLGRQAVAQGDADQRAALDARIEAEQALLREPLVAIFQILGIPTRTEAKNGGPIVIMFQMPRRLREGRVSAVQAAAGYTKDEVVRQLKGQEAGINRMAVLEWRRNRASYADRAETSTKGSGRDPASAKHQRNARLYLKGWLIDWLQNPVEGPMPLNLSGFSLDLGIGTQYVRDFAVETRARGLPPHRVPAEVSAWMSRQAALHDPDQVAGGHGVDVTDLGSRDINSSIGSQWGKDKAQELEGKVNDFLTTKKVPEDMQDAVQMDVRLEPKG